MKTVRWLIRNWSLGAALLSMLALAIAIASELFGGLLPCSLCLRQRQVFIAAIGVGVIGWLLAPRIRGVHRLTCSGLALVFVGSAALAFYHAGVEWGWFPGPASCSAGRLDVDNLINELRQPIGTVSCSEAAIRILGLSMAGWNVIFSSGLAAGSVFAAQQGAER